MSVSDNAESLKNIQTAILKAMRAYDANDLVECATFLWPVIDNTAKRETGEERVGKRIKEFLNQNTALITYVALGGQFHVVSDGKTVFDVLYKECRTHIIHEARESPLISWSKERFFVFSGEGENGDRNGTLTLPQRYLVGMMLAVIVSPVNAPLNTEEGFFILKEPVSPRLNGFKFRWGQRGELMKVIGAFP